MKKEVKFKCSNSWILRRDNRQLCFCSINGEYNGFVTHESGIIPQQKLKIRSADLVLHLIFTRMDPEQILIFYSSTRKLKLDSRVTL